MDYFMMSILFILGLSVGSFLNVLIDRLPSGQDVIFGRSHCDHCKRTLSWYELVPVVSWIFQGGKSRCCHKKLSLQYPLVELLGGCGFVMVYLFSGPSSLLLVSSLILFCSFLVICLVDLKTEYIPTAMLVAVCVGVVIRIVSLGSFALFLSTYLLPSLIAASFFFLLWFFSKGRAMGDGDIFLSFLIGCVTGYPMMIIAFYAAFLTGAGVGVILILRKVRTMKSHIPFGPFLIFGMTVALLFDKPIFHWWSTLW